MLIFFYIWARGHENLSADACINWIDFNYFIILEVCTKH